MLCGNIITAMRACDLSCKGDYAKVKFDEPLISVMSSLSRGANLLLVVSEDDRLRGIITISRVLSLLSTFGLGSKFTESSISLFIDDRPLTMHYEYPIEAALQLMAEEGKSYLVLVNGPRAMGLLTCRCIMKRLLDLGFDFKVSRVSYSSMTTLLAHNSLAEAYRAMLESGYPEVPIVEDEVVGILRANDIISEIVDKGVKELRTIKAYSKCKVIRKPPEKLSDALKLAFSEGISLIPMFKEGKLQGFVKMEELCISVLKEHGAFKIAEMMRAREQAISSNVA